MPATVDLSTLLIAVTAISVAILLFRFLWQLLVRFVKIWLITLILVLVGLLAYTFFGPSLL